MKPKTSETLTAAIDVGANAASKMRCSTSMTRVLETAFRERLAACEDFHTAKNAV
jgi:hypothetical protein